jgi:hypothetical protein
MLCPSSEGQIVYLQHMVSSLSMSGRGGHTVHWLKESSVKQRILSQPVYCMTTTATDRE